MANPYFRNIPDFEYVSRAPEPKNISDYATVKNLFKRGKLREEIFANLNFFTKYDIIGDERPDNVAFKVYDDETLDWVILLSNNILNIRTEWPMPQRAFDRFLIGKYKIGNEDEEDTYSRIYNGIPTIPVTANGIPVTASGIPVTAGGTGGILLTVGGTGGTPVTADGTPVTAGGTGGIPVTADRNPLTVGGTNETPVTAGAIGGTPVTAGGTGGTPVTAGGTPVTAGGISGVHHYESPEIKNSSGITILKKGLRIPQNFRVSYYDSLLGINVTESNFAIPVTNFEFENQIQDKKRNIFILKPIYLNVVYNDLDAIMPYKSGSAQYISRNLKRGDNIRLYN